MENSEGSKGDFTPPPKELRLPGNPERKVTVAHFPKSPEARLEILRRGLLNIAGRDTLTAYRGPDYFSIAAGTNHGNSYNRRVEPVLFRVPKKYLGYPDSSTGGQFGSGGRGLAIYHPTPSAPDRTAVHEDIISGRMGPDVADLYKRGYPLAYLPPEYVVTDIKPATSPTILEKARNFFNRLYFTYLGNTGIKQTPNIEVQRFLKTLPEGSFLKRLDLTRKGNEKTLGLHVGGFFKNREGETVYFKSYSNADQSKSEFAASNFYRDLGLNVPITRLVVDDSRGSMSNPNLGKIIGVASNKVGGLKEVRADSSGEVKRGARMGYLASAWLGNRGAYSFGNITHKWRSVVFLDQGGSLRYREQGALKQPPLSAEVTELDGFLDPRIHPNAARILNGLTEQEIREQALVMREVLTDELIEKRVKEVNLEEADNLIITLKARRNYILKRYLPEQTTV